MTATLHIIGSLVPGGSFRLAVLPAEAVLSPAVTIDGDVVTPTDGIYSIPIASMPGDAIVATANGLTRATAVADFSGTTWVIPLATQSNMVGAAIPNHDVRWPSNVRFALPSSGRLVKPGDYVPTIAEQGRYVLAKHFAIAFIDDNPDDTIIFIAGANGGTGFADNRWNPGNDLYESLIDRTLAQLTANPHAQVRCLLIQGFEEEASSSTPYLTFRSMLAAFVAGVRSDLSSPNLSIVMGEMASDYVGAISARIAIRDEMLSTPTRIAHTASVSSRTPTVLATHDGTHFTASAAAQIGKRLYAGLAAADANAL